MSTRVYDAKGDNGNQDLGEHIEVKFIKNEGHSEHWFDNDEYTVVANKNLKELSQYTPDELAVELEDGGIFWDYKKDGIPAGGADDLRVLIEFVDNGEDQNIFQGDSLELTWEFTAEQEDGERR